MEVMELMDIEIIAKAFKELGHSTRLNIYQDVIRAGYVGISVGNLQDKLGIPGSTLSHHIASLVSAGLIVQQREGRTLLCIATFEVHQVVIDFLQQECCLGEKQRRHHSVEM